MTGASGHPRNFILPVFLLVLSPVLQSQGMPPNMANRGWPPGPPFAQGQGTFAKGLEVGPPGRWWDNPRMAQELSLTIDQQKRMDAVFVQSRVKLTQVDRVAQARAELEKVNGRMLFGLREVLTLEQWKRLQAQTSPWQGRWR